MDLGQHILVGAAEAARGAAMDLFQGGRPVDPTIANFPLPGPHAARFQGEAQALLALTQRRLGLLALGDVAEVPHPAIVRAVRTFDRSAVAIEDPAIFQQNLLATLLVRMLVQISYPRQKLLRIDQ